MQNQKILLVEGIDDKFVIANLLKYRLKIEKVERIINIIDQKGVDNLLENIPVEIKNNSELQRFGIVIDADTDIAARWQAIYNRFKTLNIELPNKPEPDGTILNFTRADEQEIRIGIWIMPDNKVPGMLEDFVAFLILEEDMLWDRAKSCVDQIQKKEFAFDIEKKDLFSWQKKAEIHTWLAWQEEPGKPLGLAISAKYLDPESPYADKFMNWLKFLFEL